MKRLAAKTFATLSALIVIACIFAPPSMAFLWQKGFQDYLQGNYKYAEDAYTACGSNDFEVLETKSDKTSAYIIYKFKCKSGRYAGKTLRFQLSGRWDDVAGRRSEDELVKSGWELTNNIKEFNEKRSALSSSIAQQLHNVWLYTAFAVLIVSWYRRFDKYRSLSVDRTLKIVFDDLTLQKSSYTKIVSFAFVTYLGIASGLALGIVVQYLIYLPNPQFYWDFVNNVQSPVKFAVQSPVRSSFLLFLSIYFARLIAESMVILERTADSIKSFCDRQ